jgi:DNA-directed RNA polymerase subunit K/omega
VSSPLFEGALSFVSPYLRSLICLDEALMVKRPYGMNAFEFAVLSGLRAAQLSRGCLPRVARSAKTAVTAQHEVADGKVVRSVSVGETPTEG